MNTKKFFVLPLVLACFIYQSETVAQTSKVEWSSFNMGFAAPASVNNAIKSAVGQAFVGGTQQGNTVIESGFLAHPFFRGDSPTVVEDRGVNGAVPSAYVLQPNYPNPFNPTTMIQFALPKASEVSLKVFDANGREVLTLVTGKLAAGVHEVILDASRLTSGMYFYRLQAEGFSQTRRLMLVK